MRKGDVNTKPLERCINRFTRRFRVKAVASMEFVAFYEKRVIWFPVFEGKGEDAGEHLFAENLVKQYPQILNFDFKVWTISLLHELGHCVLGSIETAADKEVREHTRQLCADGKAQEGNAIYFELKDEKRATKWAVWYAVTHYKEVAKFEKRIFRKFEKFYKKHLTNE